MVTVKIAAELEDIREDLSEIFVTNHESEFGFLFKEKYSEEKKQKIKRQLIEAFCHMFELDSFYVALGEEHAIGMMGISGNKKRAMNLDLKELKKALGGKGKICYEKFKYISYPISHYPDDTAFLEPIEILPEFKDPSAEEELINYVVADTPYKVYIAELYDDQEELLKVYKRCGFFEIERHLIKNDDSQRYSVILRKIKK
ncbi:MAG TPA: hypothetical protein VIL23_00725 [Clostridia bacterium]